MRRDVVSGKCDPRPGVDEVGQMNSQLIVGFVQVVFGRILDGAVHPLDLTVRPGMLGLGHPMIDIVEGAGLFEDVRGRAAAGQSSP